MAENKMRDGIIKRGKTWTYMVRERDPETGTTKQRWVGGFRTREEAKEARDKARNNVRRGTYAAPSRVTVAEWLDRWLAAQVHLRPKTRDGYVQKIEDYIKPKLGTERLQALSAERLTAVWAELVESGGKNGKPLAVTTVAPCRMILRKACKDAQGAAGGRLLEVNPVDGSKVPKGGRKHNAISSWTPEEQAVFLASPVVLASRWRPVWALALATGMRRGELCGLRWQDVDFAEGIVRAERSCVQIGKEIITNDTTKTGTVRRIAIDRTTLGMLRELRKQQAAERLAMGGAWGNDEDLVFVWPDGSRVTPDYVTKRFIDEQEARRPEKQ
ncbi:MAG: tyrosine-type recombinase/integrase, partial [Propionicimonas sp.]|nr:tyrosine-type recombinase/integrase [Propionicimonas sp.]